MRIPIKRTLALFYALFLAASLCYIVYSSSLDKLIAVGETGLVRPVSGVTYATETGARGTLRLPAKVENLSPRTEVTLSAELTTGSRDSLLVKSVFAPIRIYVNDTLIYEYGQEGSYPSYMNDPPTILSVIPLPSEGESVSLRMTYLSPTQRTVLSLPAMYIGEEMGLLAHQFYADGFSFLFSLLLIFMGIVMMIISLTFIRKIPSGSSFLWLGLFSLAAGVWGLGECDLSAFLLPYPSLLYSMAYGGLFTVTIPFLHFGMIVLNPRDKLPVTIMLGVHYFSLIAALILQLSGMVDFTKSLYWFHIIAPLGFLVFALCLIWEYFRHHNQAAARFAPAIILLAASTVLEVLNYWLNLTYTLTLFFQLGVLCFVIALGVVSGHYMKNSLYLAAEKKRLEYEMAAMFHHLELQRLQYRKMAENDKEIKSQRHDLRHQLAVLRSLSKEEEHLKNYIDGLIAKIPTGQGLLLCENYAVNAVAAYYYTIAQQEGFSRSAQLIIPANLSSSQEIDLCIILGNLLENAIEACRRMEKGDPFIHINSHLKYEVLTITVDNSFTGILKEKEDLFLSSKRDGEGTGLSSIKAVAQKYHGGARFTAKEGVFQASVYVKLMESGFQATTFSKL